MNDSASEKDTSISNAIQEQLAINQLQQLQLEGALLTASSRIRIYLLLCLVLGSALVCGVLVIFWLRSGRLGSLIDLFPAAFVFALFGLYRCVHNLIEARATWEQLRLVLAAQGKAIGYAENALRTVSPVVDRRTERRKKRI